MKKITILLTLLVGFVYGQNLTIPCDGVPVTGTDNINTFFGNNTGFYADPPFTYTICPSDPSLTLTFNSGVFNTIGFNGSSVSVTSLTDVNNCVNITFTIFGGNFFRYGELTSFSNYDIVCEPPLPITLSYFNGSAEPNSNYLNWGTFTEINSLGYVVEASTEPTSFDSIGFISSNNAPLSEYEFIHSTNNPMTFYRLKHIDFDGTFQYSPIVEVNRKSEKEFGVYPNPFSTTLKTTISDSYKIVNGVGSIVHTFSGNSTDVSFLPSGVYILTNGRNHMKVVKR